MRFETKKVLFFAGAAFGIGVIYDALFGCHHSHHSFPLKPTKGTIPKAATYTGQYVVCLDCGKEFPYDLSKMRIMTIRQAERQKEQNDDLNRSSPG